MKKIIVLFLASGLFFQLFSATAFALSYYPGTTNCTSQYGYTTCRCPDGTIVYGSSNCPNMIMCSNGTYALHQYGCPSHVPTCMTPAPGQITIQTASLCKCPDGTYRMSTGGYAYCQQPTTVTCWDGSTATNQNACPGYKYCPGDTITKRALSYTCSVPTCMEPVPGMVYPAVNISCKCPDGRIIGSNGGYATCQIRVNCWDGSIAVNQNACPAYKYCPGDNATKRSLSYTCPVQTQTCWNGQVISIYQQCPTQTKTCPNGQVIYTHQMCPVQPMQPACTYTQYWNGYSCVNIYNPYQPQTDWYNSYQDYGYYNYNDWNSDWRYDDQYYW